MFTEGQLVAVMDYPKSSDEWWNLLYGNKNKLISLICSFYPIGAKSSEEYEISASMAEKACEVIREQIAKENLLNPKETFLEAVFNKDARTAVNILSNTWFGLPESMGSRDLPGFSALCDLCSESDLVVNYENEDL